MATPDYEQLVPSIGDFEDKAVHSNLVDLAKGRQLDGIKQSLSAYRRKRTVAHNAIKDIRRLIADEPLEGAEKIERDQTLTKQVSIWSDANKACRSLEKIEEAMEYANVFEDVPGQLSSDDEGWLTTTSGQEEPPPLPRRSLRVGTERRTPLVTPKAVEAPVSTSPIQQNSARGVTTQTVTKIDLPKLKDKFSLQHHLRVCENMLQEAEVGVDVDGQFQPLVRLQYNVVTKILGTLVDHKDIFQLAPDTAEQSDHDWVYVRRVLLTTYAKRETLVDEYRAAALRIKYVNCDKFCADARKLYAMASRLFGIRNTYEIRGLVETLVSRLPPERASALISEVHRLAGLAGYSPDWPLAVAFDDDEQSLLGILGRIDRQEGAVRSLRAVSRVDAARLAEVEGFEEDDAKVADVAKSGKGYGPRTQAPPNSAREWCSKYASDSLIKVYECWGDRLKMKVPEMVASFALKTKFRRNPIFRIVALKQGVQRDGVISRLKEEGLRADTFTPFQ